MISNEQMRRQVIVDRLEALMADVQRYQDDAYEADDVDEATRWFVLAAALRGTIAMVNA